MFFDDELSALVEAKAVLEEEKVRRQNQRARWMRWKPSELEQWVLFIRCKGSSPVYTHYATWVPSSDGRGVLVPCRCKNEQENTPCVVHHLRRQYLKRNQLAADDMYRVRAFHAVTVVLWNYWHYKPEVVSKDNDVTVTMKWVPCDDMREKVEGDTECRICRMAETYSSSKETESSLESASWLKHRRVFGLKRYIDMGANYFDSFLAIGRRLSRICLCGGRISTVKYVCRICYERGNTTVLLDPRDTSLSKEHIATFWKQAVFCPTCGYRAIPKEIIRCDSCNEPKPRSIFTQPICIAKEGERTSARLVLLKYAEDCVDLNTLPADLVEPFNFDQMFDITTAEQAQLLGVADPFSKQGDVTEVRFDSTEYVDYEV